MVKLLPVRKGEIGRWGKGRGRGGDGENGWYREREEVKGVGEGVVEEKRIYPGHCLPQATPTTPGHPDHPRSPQVTPATPGH